MVNLPSGEDHPLKQITRSFQTVPKAISLSAESNILRTHERESQEAINKDAGPE